MSRPRAIGSCSNPRQKRRHGAYYYHTLKLHFDPAISYYCTPNVKNRILPGHSKTTSCCPSLARRLRHTGAVPCPPSPTSWGDCHIDRTLNGRARLHMTDHPRRKESRSSLMTGLTDAAKNKWTRLRDKSTNERGNRQMSQMTTQKGATRPMLCHAVAQARILILHEPAPSSIGPYDHR